MEICVHKRYINANRMLKYNITFGIGNILNLTSNSQPSSLGLTLHIILTTLLVSTSTGSGVTDFTDSATSGDIGRGRGGGGCRALNAVSG